MFSSNGGEEKTFFLIADTKWTCIQIHMRTSVCMYVYMYVYMFYVCMYGRLYACLHIDFLSHSYTVTGVVTQGRGDDAMWVTQFYLAFSNRSESWEGREYTHQNKIHVSECTMKSSNTDPLP